MCHKGTKQLEFWFYINKNKIMIKYILLGFFAVMSTMVTAQDIVKLNTQQALDDIDFMIKTIESVHYNPYELITRESFIAKKDSIVAIWPKTDEIPLRLFMISTLKIAALLEGGNVSVEWQNPKLFPELGAYAFLPFKMKRTKGKIICSYSLTNEVKVGDEILTINGANAEKIYNDVNTYSGNVTKYIDEFNENFLPLYLFLNGQKAPYFIEKESGEIGYIGTGLSMVDASLLLTSHLPKEQFSLKYHNNDIALLTLNTTVDVDSFRTFIDNSFQEIKDKGVTNLIVDIRKNNSSNPALNDILLSYITKKKYRQTSGRYWKVSPQMKKRFQDSIYIADFGEKFAAKFIASADQSIIKDLDKKRTKPSKQENLFEGVSCFLIGPGTLGSAADLADAIQANELSALIGQATGELTNAYGELIEEVMPNSQTYFFLPSTYDLGADGNSERRSPVEPDLVAEKNEIEVARNWLMSN